ARCARAPHAAAGCDWRGGGAGREAALVRTAAPSAAGPAAPRAREGRMTAAYPVFLRLEGRRVLVVGGGKLAAAKLPPLIEAGARVTVVAPDIRTELVRPGVELLRDPFSRAHLEGVFFVVAAATPAVNREVAAAAEARSLFVNAVDDVQSASAWL